MATGGAATPAPPLGPVLGSKGVNPGQFIQKFNAATQNVKGKVVGCIVTVYSDRSFDFEVCAMTRVLGHVRGTHFLWHLLNSLTLFLIMLAAIRHGTGPEQSRIDSGAPKATSA